MRLKGFMKTGALVRCFRQAQSLPVAGIYPRFQKLYHAFMDAPDPSDG